MRCVANRARKSEPPQVKAVSRPIKIPIRLVSHHCGGKNHAGIFFTMLFLILGLKLSLGSALSFLLRVPTRPSPFANLSRLRFSPPDYAGDKRDDRWPSASFRETPATARET